MALKDFSSGCARLSGGWISERVYRKILFPIPARNHPPFYVSFPFHSADTDVDFDVDVNVEVEVEAS